MSSITGVSNTSTTTNPLLTDLASTIQANFGQVLTDFKAMGTALQSGNMTSAQTALAALQNDFPAGLQSMASQPFGGNTQANAIFQNLTSDLKSGNLAGAQKAFANLQTELNLGQSSSSTTTGTATGTSSFGSILSNILSENGISFPSSL